MLQKAHESLTNFWWWLRQVSGDADYENYLRRVATDSLRADFCRRVLPAETAT